MLVAVVVAVVADGGAGWEDHEVDELDVDGPGEVGGLVEGQS